MKTPLFNSNLEVTLEKLVPMKPELPGGFNHPPFKPEFTDGYWRVSVKSLSADARANMNEIRISKPGGFPLSWYSEPLKMFDVTVITGKALGMFTLVPMPDFVLDHYFIDRDEITLDNFSKRKIHHKAKRPYQFVPVGWGFVDNDAARGAASQYNGGHPETEFACRSINGTIFTFRIR